MNYVAVHEKFPNKYKTNKLVETQTGKYLGDPLYSFDPSIERSGLNRIV